MNVRCRRAAIALIVSHSGVKGTEKLIRWQSIYCTRLGLAQYPVAAFARTRVWCPQRLPRSGERGYGTLEDLAGTRPAFVDCQQGQSSATVVGYSRPRQLFRGV